MSTLVNFNIMSIRDFAKSINKPKSTIYGWRRDKSIPEKCFKMVGKSIFVRVSEMTDFLNS